MSAIRRTCDQTTLQCAECLLAVSSRLNKPAWQVHRLVSPTHDGNLKPHDKRVTRTQLGQLVLQGLAIQISSLMGSLNGFYNMRKTRNTTWLCWQPHRNRLLPVCSSLAYVCKVSLTINEKLLELIGEFSKVSEYKVNIQKSLFYILAAHNWKKSKNITAISLIIALINKIQMTCNNYKTFLKRKSE